MIVLVCLAKVAWKRHAEKNYNPPGLAHTLYNNPTVNYLFVRVTSISVTRALAGVAVTMAKAGFKLERKYIFHTHMLFDIFLKTCRNVA